MGGNREIEVTADQVAQGLEAFVRERFQVDGDDEFFTLDVNLWEEGYVDSAGVVELIAHLEDSYKIQIPRSMLFDPGFTTVAGIAERVAGLL